jgi:hypothetical protein
MAPSEYLHVLHGLLVIVLGLSKRGGFNAKTGAVRINYFAMGF